MSAVPRCTVCDAALNPWGQETRCDRCSEPCETCGRVVGFCSHPLPVPYTRMSIELRDDGGRVAA